MGLNMSTKATVRVVIDITTGSAYGDGWSLKDVQRTSKEAAEEAARRMCAEVKGCGAQLVSVGDVVTVTIVDAWWGQTYSASSNIVPEKP